MDAASPIETFDEETLCWTGGTLHLKQHEATTVSHYAFLRNDTALCIVLPMSSNEARWKICGDLAEFRSLIVTPPRLFVVPPGCKFEAQRIGACRCLWIFVDSQRGNGDDDAYSFLRNKCINGSWSRNAALLNMIEDFMSICVRELPPDQLYIDNTVSNLMNDFGIFFDRSATKFNPAPLSEDKLNIVVDYIERNLDRNIAISEMSGLVDLTRRYFCASFKEAMGRPPHWFHLERRVERAKCLLRDPHLTLAQIAKTVGFNSETHLVHSFRRIEGTTPGRLRAQLHQS